MKVIGITGPTGAGKTTVLRYLQSKGTIILDCDAIYHDLLSKPSTLYHAVKAAFPDAFTPAGELDRKKLGKLVFQDEAQMAKLNEMVYLHLGSEVQATLKTLAGKAKLVAIDAVNLIQSGLSALCHVTFAVLAEEEIRLGRIMARDGISREYAAARIAAQPQADYYRKNCDFVLENNGTEEALLTQTESALKDYLKGE